MVQASLPPNPSFSLERIAGGGALEIERRIVANILSLATLPARAEIAADRFRQAQFQAAARNPAHRRAKPAALFSARSRPARWWAFSTRRGDRGETAAQLAKRLGETGAMNKLDQARNQVFYAELVAQLATARQRAAAERERLVRALGLWGAISISRCPRAAAAAARPRALAAIEIEAVRRRVDLQMARIEAEAAREVLRPHRRDPLPQSVGGCAGSPRRSRRETARTARERGFEVELQVPLFDFGEVASRQAEETYLQAVNRLTAKAVNVRSEAREAYQAYRASYDIARHYRREVLPLRKIISDETLLRYNAMQIDVFALLTEARQRIAATSAAIEAERDFWLAETNLGAAVLGGGARAAARTPRADPRAGRKRPAATEQGETPMKISREILSALSAGTLAGAAAVVRRAQAAAIPEAATQHRAHDAAAARAGRTGQAYQPVVTLNGWTLPWRMKDGWKEFHLVAEPVVREMAPGMKAHLWGYNGASPGPTIEAVEGDKVRIFVTNKLPEHTTVHWHGMLLPNGMDGVGGLTQPHIKPGKTFVYEFVLKKSGTFMYHPHADEMVQMAMGMMGFFVVHPRDPAFMRVDRDFVFLMQSYDIDPGSYMPKVMTMLDFNLWAWNSRVFPGIDPLVVRQGDRVRVRIGNLTMTNHPIHMHGYHFHVTCTDGGWIPETRAHPGSHDRRAGRRHARLRVRRRRAGRLGDPLPQVAPHHERDGPRREDLHRRQQEGPRADDPQAGAGLHADGLGRHGGDGRDGNADARQHAADDDRLRPVRPDGDGRHVLGGEGARGPRARRLQGPRPLQAPARHRRLRGRDRVAAAPARAARQKRPTSPPRNSTSSSRAASARPSISTEKEQPMKRSRLDRTVARLRQFWRSALVSGCAARRRCA